MGKHYIPRYYLNGFTALPSSRVIWVYEKGSRRKFSTNIAQVANETGFYSDETEAYLANEIEAPAQPVLAKIRSREPIAARDKATLAAYMTVMLKRVPQGQVRMQESAPQIIESVFGELDNEILEMIEAYPSNTEILERRREELRTIRAEYEANVLKEIWYQLLPPETAPRLLAALRSMTWRFLTFDKEPAFLTSDNPVFFFKGLGIGNAESEVTFPISQNTVLWATWRMDLKEGYFPAKETVVHEVNRRTASAATRYAFHSVEAEWVVNLVNKKSHKLKRMR